MAKSTLAVFLLCSLTVVLLEGPQSQAVPSMDDPPALQTVSLPFETSRLGIAVTARVAGREGSFLLDTGATRTIVSPHLSGLSPTQLAATAHSKADNVVLGGEKSVPLASLRIRIGDTVFTNAYVWVTDVKGFDGVLGLDLLSKFKSIKIDYTTKTVQLVQ